MLLVDQFSDLINRDLALHLPRRRRDPCACEGDVIHAAGRGGQRIINVGVSESFGKE